MTWVESLVFLIINVEITCYSALCLCFPFFLTFVQTIAIVFKPWRDEDEIDESIINLIFISRGRYWTSWVSKTQLNLKSKPKLCLWTLQIFSFLLHSHWRHSGLRDLRFLCTVWLRVIRDAAMYRAARTRCCAAGGKERKKGREREKERERALYRSRGSVLSGCVFHSLSVSWQHC